MGNNCVYVPPLPMSAEIEVIRCSFSSKEQLINTAGMLYTRCQIQVLLGEKFSPVTREIVLSNQDYVEMMAKVGVFLVKADRMSVESLKNVVSFYHRQSLFYQQKNGITQ